MLSYTKREQWIDQNGTTREAKLIALPWSKGLSVEETEVYYDDGSNFPDGKPSVHIVNEFSKAPTILAEHPDFELFQKGVHAKNGVACADCHLPYASEGGSKFTHHSMSKPLENMDKSCLNCHGNKEKQLREIVAEKKQRVDTLGKKTLDNLAKAHLEAKKAWEAGAKEEEMKEALNFIRKAQWRYSYVRSSFGAYFHATDESLRIYGDANDYAQKARIEIIKVLAKHGVIGYEAPEFQTKEEVFKYANLPNRENFIKEKCEWIYATGRKWLKEAKEKGTLSEELYGIENSITWHDLNCKK